MAKQVTFKVSKRGGPSTEVSFLAPENLQDPRWAEVLSSNPEQDVHELALQNLIIKMQGGARQHLDKGPEAVQAYVDQYKFRARTGFGAASVTLSAEKAQELGFSEDQIAALKAAGVKIPGVTDVGEEGDDEFSEEELAELEA
ncbi:MAG: hypothetical protein J5I35_07665 [Methanothrix harundinacea]|nr:hypothetical protein [Methanothrix harundinacea]